MPFFEALVGRFYDGVADRSGPPPALPGAGPGRRPPPPDAVPHPVLGRPDDLRRRSAATRGCGCATRRSRSGRPSATLARPHARGDRRDGAAGRRRRRARALLRRWPPRRCATATDAAGRPGPAGRPGTTVARQRGERRADRRWREATDERTDAPARTSRAGRRPSDASERGKTVHGEAANAGHRVLAPDDAEVEAYLETALNAPAADRSRGRSPGRGRPPTTASTGRRPRLRQPVRPAHRPPRPRARRLLGAAAARHAVRRARAARRRGRSSCRAARTRSTTPGAPRPDPAIWTGRIPVLGHLLRRPADGPRARRRRPPVRPPRVRPGQRHHHRRRRPLFAGIEREQPVWMSHGDSISRLPEGFRATAQTDSTPFAGLVDAARNLYGIQFHPEVVHTPRGRDVLRNFVVDIAGVAPTWTAGQLHRDDRRRHPRAGRRARRARPARTAWSSARCRAASTRRSRRRSSIARSATG